MCQQPGLLAHFKSSVLTLLARMHYVRVPRDPLGNTTQYAAGQADVDSDATALLVGPEDGVRYVLLL
jgi:hypothetical protein